MLPFPSQYFYPLKKKKISDPFSREVRSLWRPEYAEYMVEGTPGHPYGSLVQHFNIVEHNMSFRRSEVQSLLQPDEVVLSLTNFFRWIWLCWVVGWLWVNIFILFIYLHFLYCVCLCMGISVRCECTCMYKRAYYRSVRMVRSLRLIVQRVSFYHVYACLHCDVVGISRHYLHLKLVYVARLKNLIG